MNSGSAERRFTLRWLIGGLVVWAIATPVASAWVHPALAAVGVGLLVVILFAVVQDYWRHRATRGRRSLNPYLVESPPGAEQIGDETERPDHTVGRFGSYAHAEGLAEFEEAMTTERLRTRGGTEREHS